MRRSKSVLAWAWAGTCLLGMLGAQGCGPDEAPPAVPKSCAYDAEGLASHPPAARGRRPNLVLIVIDTLRADAVRPATPQTADMPALSRRARSSVACSQASAASSWTLPSIASLFTGVLPRRHGISIDDIEAPRLETPLTWALAMRATLGYSTAAFFGGLGAGNVRALHAGFDRVHDDFDLQRAPAHLAPWVAARDPQRPFFLLLHSFEAHDPYGGANHPPGGPRASAADLAALEALGEDPPTAELVRRFLLDVGQRTVLSTNPRFHARRSDILRFLWDGIRKAPDPELVQSLASAYREGLHWVDGHLEATLAYLQGEGLLDNTLLVVTGDHGEAFGEHGMLAHARQLYDELVRVPLLLQGPPPFDRPTDLTPSVGLIDLFPTVLEWLGAPVPEGLDGVSFLDHLQGQPSARVVIAEAVRTHTQTVGASAAVLGSVRDAAWKYIGTHEFTDGSIREELFDLRLDPGEQHPRSGPDGLLHDLPTSAEFRGAVERVRDLLWEQSRQIDWRVERTRTQPLRTSSSPRPSPGTGATR